MHLARYKWNILPAILFIGFVNLRANAQNSPDAIPIRYRLSDCHLHYVDFLQHTEGMKALISALDRAGVDNTMICGMPVIKEWSRNEPTQPKYYLDDDARCYWYSATDVLVANVISKLSMKDRSRFHPFICGFNGADRNAVEHVERMMEWYPDLWEGIGEVMARHDDLTALTYGETSQANSGTLYPVFDLAARHDLPVFIHSDISSVWKREPLYLKEIEDAVRTHPKTRFVWCHAGISRRINVPTITTELRRMLKTYLNLWIDLSWVVFDTYIYTLNPDGKDSTLHKDWVNLISEFPDRFMIGSDKVGKFSDYPPEVQRYYHLLDALNPNTAQKIAKDNFLSVLPSIVRKRLVTTKSVKKIRS